MDKEINQESDKEIEYSREGVRFKLIPYVDGRGYARLKWNIDGRKGIDAVFLSGSNILRLPRNRSITIKGQEEKSTFDIPPKVADIIVDEFEDLGVELDD